MISFIQENYINILILAILAVIIGLIIKSMIKTKNSGCNGDCASCHSACNRNQLVKTTLTIGGMMCNMCENHINDAIRQNFQIKKVKSSHKNGKTVIISEHRLDEKLLRQTIEKTGYELKNITFELA